MTTKQERVKRAMAGAKPVDDAPPFDPSEVPGLSSHANDDEGDGLIPPGDLPIVEECAELDQNDRDNGRRLIIWYGLDLAYVPGMGWLVFTSTHWLRDEGELRVRYLAQELVDKIKLEAQALYATPRQAALIAAADAILQKEEKDITTADRQTIAKADKARVALSKRRSARTTFAVSSGNAGRTDAMLRQAASRAAIDPEDLDADRMRFNVQNGTLVFDRDLDPERPEGSDRKIGTVDLVEHDRDDYLTKVAEVDYDEDATCPEFMAFLERVQPDERMRRFLQVAHGYALLIGGNDEQRLLFHYGTGANGKSAFIEALGRLAGAYRAVVAPETITGDNQKDGSKANNDIARLVNCRFVTIEELPRGVNLKENLIKALTGGTRMVARFMQKEFFEFEPIFTAVMSGNDMPTVSGTDYGIWRRLLIVHWGVTIPEGERIAPGELAARFDRERSGILNWLIDGLKLYLAQGLTPFIPRSVTDFTDDYREERDPVGTFAGACLIPAEDVTTPAGELFKAYTEWCEFNGIKAWSQTAFGTRLVALGYKKLRGRNVVYQGVRVGDVPSRFDPPPNRTGDPGWSPP